MRRVNTSCNIIIKRIARQKVMVFDFLSRNAFVKVAIGHELYTPML